MYSATYFKQVKKFINLCSHWVNHRWWYSGLRIVTMMYDVGKVSGVVQGLRFATT